MNTTGKWLARAGGLLLLVGFFLPVVSVSCGGMKESSSLLDLTKIKGGMMLLAVLFFILVMIVLSFLPVKVRSSRILLIIGQLALVALSLLIILVTLGYLYTQVQQVSDFSDLFAGTGISLLDFNLEYGAIILLLGFLLAGVGVILQFFEKDGDATGRLPIPASPPEMAATPPPPPMPGVLPPAPTPLAGLEPRPTTPMTPMVKGPGARLEILRGQASQPVLLSDNFVIGRGSGCQLQIPDTIVSRQHARIRFASGAWFLQDMGSSSGTIVNGKKVQATRLNPGDEITIGSTTFIFKV